MGNFVSSWVSSSVILISRCNKGFLLQNVLIDIHTAILKVMRSNDCFTLGPPCPMDHSCKVCPYLFFITPSIYLSRHSFLFYAFPWCLICSCLCMPVCARRYNWSCLPIFKNRQSPLSYPQHKLDYILLVSLNTILLKINNISIMFKTIFFTDYFHIFTWMYRICVFITFYTID